MFAALMLISSESNRNPQMLKLCLIGEILIPGGEKKGHEC